MEIESCKIVQINVMYKCENYGGKRTLPPPADVSPYQFDEDISFSGHPHSLFIQVKLQLSDYF